MPKQQMIIMDTFYNKLLILLAVTVFSQSLLAQEVVSKRITKSYDMTNAGELRLYNEYGDITINGWDKKSVAITVEVTVTHKKKENAENLLKRITTQIKDWNNVVEVTSAIAEKNTGFFSKYFNLSDVLDFNRSNLQIDYTIYLPSNAKLDIENKFGDVVIEGWNGKLKVNLQHSDLWINEDLNNAEINVKYGKVNAKSIDYANIQLKNGDLEIDNAKDVNINSGGSNIEIGQVTSLEIYSSKDEIDIAQAGKVLGNLKFSNMKLGEVTNDIKLDLKIADLRVSKITNPVAHISLGQVSSQIAINISDFGFLFDAVLEEGLLRLPKTFENVESIVTDKANRIRKINASYGKSTTGRISIRGKKGAVLLKES